MIFIFFAGQISQGLARFQKGQGMGDGGELKGLPGFVRQKIATGLVAFTIWETHVPHLRAVYTGL